MMKATSVCTMTDTQGRQDHPPDLSCILYERPWLLQADFQSGQVGPAPCSLPEFLGLSHAA